MLRLQTFGAVFLADVDGAPLGGAASQRRLIALLSVLAASGDAGMSREKIVALLWPESDEERARHALTQALYHARRTLGHDDLFIASGDVRLNRERITSDVQELEGAIESGRFEQAAALYRGPFLDGFFLSGSSAFEQWASAQRSRLATRIATALDALATAATQEGDHTRAVEWRRQLVALDPLDTGATMALIEALSAAGDRTAALQHARVHELLLREQLEIAPSPALLALVERVRTEPAREETGAATSAREAPGVAPPAGGATIDTTAPYQTQPNNTEAASASVAPATASEVADTAPREPVAHRDDQTVPSGRRHGGSRRRWWLAVAASAVLLVGGVTAIAHRAAVRAANAAAAAEPRHDVVVAPFRVAGADASLGYLREGIVDLLSMRLGDDAETRAVDPGAVLGAWRAAGLGSATDVPREQAVRLAERFRAAQVVVGSVVGSTSKMVITATVLDVASGQPVAKAEVEGPADSLTTLVDRIAVRLLAAEAGEGERLADHTTPSVVSLRAYLEGRAASRRGSYLEAARHFERALQRDSSFALAAFHLALVADRLNDAEQHARALDLAWNARGDLNARDEAHLVAFAGPRYPAPSTEAEQLAAWERAAAIAPDRAEVWQELGERFFHSGAVLRATDATARAAAAFRRALELDPSSTAARRFLILLAARTGDTTTLAHVATPRALADSVGGLTPFLRWRLALVRNDAVLLRRVRAELPQLDDANLRAIALASQFDAVGVEDGERALRIRQIRASRAAEVLDALLAQHSLALNEGRPVLALDVTEQMQELQPGSRAHLRLRVLDALHGGGDQAAAALAAESLTRAQAGAAPRTAMARALRVADDCVLAQWQLATGDRRSARAAIERLRASDVAREPVPVGASPLACAELLEAQLAVATNRSDALARVARVDSLMLGGPAVGDAGTYAHLVIARLYEQLGERPLALQAIRRRAYMTGWPRYLATARREEGRLAALVGDRTGAELAYRRYLALRDRPEGTAIADVRAVRAALSQLATSDDR